MRFTTIATTELATTRSLTMTTKQLSPEPDRIDDCKRSKRPASSVDQAVTPIFERSVFDVEEATSGHVSSRKRNTRATSSSPTLAVNAWDYSGLIQTTSSSLPMPPASTSAQVAARAPDVASKHLEASDSDFDEEEATALELTQRRPRGATLLEYLMILPVELRECIYTFVVGLDRPIQPHYCGRTEHGLRFHEDQFYETGDHDEVWRMLAITRVNKQLRQESLPIFYRENTFAYGLDTRTYFETLASLGRFNLVRHVSFDIFFHHRESHVQRVLKDIYDVLNLDSRSPPLPLSKSVRDASMYAGMFLLLRKLSKAFAEDEKTVALQVPVPEWFDELPGLAWFKEVARGAGLKIKLIPNGKLLGHENSRIRVHWYHRCQKEAQVEGAARDTAQQVLKKGFQKYPHLQRFYKPRTIFYRKNCRGGITWFQEV